MSEAGNEDQVQWLLAQSIEISGVVQERAAAAVNETLELIDRFKDEKKKAMALHQVVDGLENVDASAKFAGLQFHLGSLYHQGIHLESNPQQAASYYHKAARQGHVGAQVALALMHLGGEVVNPDVVEAFVWLEHAANQGHAEAQVSLGMMYALGKGVEADLASAHKWVTLSAAQGNREARSALAQLSGKLSSVQLEQSAGLVKQWHAVQSGARDNPIVEKEKEASAN